MKKIEYDFNSVCTAIVIAFVIVLGTIAIINCDKVNREPKTGLTWIKYDANGIEHSIK